MSSSFKLGYALIWPGLILVAGVSLAQERPGGFRFELSPFAAARFSGTFEQEDGDGRFDIDDSAAHGVVFNAAARSGGQWEALYARQSTEVETQSILANEPTLDLEVEHLHFGGTHLFEGIEHVPFIAFTLGVSHFEPAPSNRVSETFPSASIGGGVQLRKTSRIGVRLEGRGYVTLVDSSSDIFCNISSQANVCEIRVDGDTLWQWEARAALVFRF